MPLIKAVNKLEDRKYARKEGPRTDYARLEIDLGNADFVGTNIEIAVSGSYLAKISYDGDTTVYFRIDNRHAAPIYGHEFQTVRREFEKLWFTNPSAQAGKKLVLQIGQTDYAEITPDTEVRKVSVESRTLTIDTDGGGTNFGTPGVGMRFEIIAYSIIESEEAAMAITTPAKLKFETSSKQLWSGILVPEGAATNYRSEMVGITSIGGLNEALTLTNADVSAGSSQISAVVWYRVIKG